jgi:hypothetical protein
VERLCIALNVMHRKFNYYFIFIIAERTATGHHFSRHREAPGVLGVRRRQSFRVRGTSGDQGPGTASGGRPSTLSGTGGRMALRGRSADGGGAASKARAARPARLSGVPRGNPWRAGGFRRRRSSRGWTAGERQRNPVRRDPGSLQAGAEMRRTTKAAPGRRPVFGPHPPRSGGGSPGRTIRCRDGEAAHLLPMAGAGPAPEASGVLVPGTLSRARYTVSKDVHTWRNRLCSIFLPPQ